jgi:hypothetical protein
MPGGHETLQKIFRRFWAEALDEFPNVWCTWESNHHKAALNIAATYSV